MRLSRNFRTDSFSKSSKSLFGFSRLDILAAVAAVALLLVALGSYSLSTPTNKPIQAKIPYTQSGSFSYSAPVSSDSIYGTSGLTTGDPILLKQIPNLNVSFKYNFSSSGTSVLSGTEQLVAIINDSGVTHSIPLQANPVSVSGSTFTADGILNSSKLESIYNDFNTAFAGAGTQVTLQIVPNVRLSGSISGHRLAASYDPPILFSISDSILALANPASSQSSGLLGLDKTTTQLTPSSNGSVTYPSLAVAKLSLGFLHPSVFAVRVIALLGILACLIAAALILWPLKKAEEDESVMIDARYGPRLITVEKISFRGSAVVTTQSVAVLITLANKYNTKVLHSFELGRNRYAVFDNGVLYLYEAKDRQTTEAFANETVEDRLASGEVILDGLATK